VNDDNPEPAQARAGKALTDADRAAIRAMVATWPPLTLEQRERLRPVLSGTLPAPALAAAN